MAKRFVKDQINWIELEKRVPLDQRAKYFAFKSKADAYYRRVLANPAEPPKIDWAQYSARVQVKGLVDKFKEQYESFKVPYPQDNLTAEIDSQWQTLQGEIKNFCAEKQKEIETATKKLAELNALPKFEDMTMEMFKDMYPDEALDCVERPSFWPHNVEEQPGYQTPEQKAMKGGH